MSYKPTKRGFLLSFLVLSIFLFGCATKMSDEQTTVYDEEQNSSVQVNPADQPAANATNNIDIIRVPGGTNPADKRYNDVIEALTMALDKTKATYGDYQLIISDQPMTGSRFVEEVKSGTQVNVIWRTYSPELSKELIPIYIDPRKGILGYRVFLIREKDQPRFSKIKTLEDLKALTVGQGQDWMDIQVFEHNGVEVVTGSDYEGLFKMLINERFDYFSRGIGEIFTEYEDRRTALPALGIESELLIYYPWPYFYYVNPNEERIAKRIEAGLKLMLKDGSLDQLFEKYNAAVIKKANLKNRRIIMLENPLMKDAPFSMEDDQRWFDPYK